MNTLFGNKVVGAGLCALVLFGGVLPAAAQDYDWNGFYLGVNAGYGTGHMGVVADSTIPDYDGLEIDFDTGGGLLGGTVGANMQTQNFVFGVEADVGRTSMTGDADPINFGGDDAILTANIDWLATLRGRLGVTTGNMLFFATAGVAAGGISGSVTNFPTDGTTSSTSGSQFGYVAGVGLEAALTDNVTLKAEYLYVDLGTAPYDLPPLTANTHPTAGMVRVGLNYRFD